MTHDQRPKIPIKPEPAEQQKPHLERKQLGFITHSNWEGGGGFLIIEKP